MVAMETPRGTDGWLVTLSAPPEAGARKHRPTHIGKSFEEKSEGFLGMPSPTDYLRTMRNVPAAIVAALLALPLAVMPAKAQEGCDARVADVDGSGSVDAGDLALVLLYFGDIDPCCDVNCDDGDPNTVDSCSNGVCQHVNPCEDGNLCTIDTTDSKTGACLHTPKNCGDGNYCTLDSCDPLSGACVYTPLSGNTCDDSNPCTDGDICYVGLCRVGQPKNCNDGNPCTADSCVSGTCVHTPTGCFWGGPDEIGKVSNCALAVCGAMPTCCEIGWDDRCLELAASVDACTDIDRVAEGEVEEIR